MEAAAQSAEGSAEPAASSELSADSEAALELAFWESVKDGTPAELESYLGTGGLHDSLLERGGFEPSVPGTKEPVFVAEGELRDRTGAAKKGWFLCGTDGSNPSPSSKESAANLLRAADDAPPFTAPRLKNNPTIPHIKALPATNAAD
jgi:hypothetical protein